jgi:hypothetical protein
VVDPTTSQNKAVTRRRSSCGGASDGRAAACSIGVPHAGQNRTPGGSGVPQFGHVAARADPHDTQYREPGVFAVPHEGQATVGCGSAAGFTESLPVRPTPRAGRPGRARGG